MPLFSARIPFQNASTPVPMQVIGPSPVMTARRFIFFPETVVENGTRIHTRKAERKRSSQLHFRLFRRFRRRFQMLFHAAQRSARHGMNEEIANDEFRQW